MELIKLEVSETEECNVVVVAVDDDDDDDDAVVLDNMVVGLILADCDKGEKAITSF